MISKIGFQYGTLQNKKVKGPPGVQDTDQSAVDTLYWALRCLRDPDLGPESRRWEVYYHRFATISDKVSDAGAHLCILKQASLLLNVWVYSK